MAQQNKARDCIPSVKLTPHSFNLNSGLIKFKFALLGPSQILIRLLLNDQFFDPTMNPLNAIEESDINLNANKVIGRLKDQGFHAYLVGGCVRDLLLGLTPKDFDIATDARPEEVRDLFRNSRIIGKRFSPIH